MGLPITFLTDYGVADDFAGVVGDAHVIAGDAIAAMPSSSMLGEAFGEPVIGHYVHTGNWEQFEYDRRVTDWELKRGFERS